MPWRHMLVLLIFFIPRLVLPAEQLNLEEQARRIAAELRCPVCQNLSVADSPSELGQQMRGIIREQLQQGKNPEEIKAYFVSKYGEWVLLAPTPKGFNLLVWVLPFIAMTGGIVFVVFVVRRWVRKTGQLRPIAVDPRLIERIHQEVKEQRSHPSDFEAESPRGQFLREQDRLYTDLKEIEFDCQAGKLSEADYQDLRQGLEAQAATLLHQFESSSPSRPPAQEARPSMKEPAPTKEDLEKKKAALRGWRLPAGGAFLLVFGLTLGVLLSKSIRPRASQQDSITGDFLTGTGQGGIGSSSGMAGMEMGASSSTNISSLLTQGRDAFERQQWSQAIESFKKALAMDPNHPEAHTYMGLILAQTGHTDGALTAFDRALSSNPNFPLALWGKGMVLYQTKQDLSGARQTLEKLVSLLSPGDDRNEIQKTLTEIAQLSSAQKQDTKIAGAEAAQREIRGTISIDSQLKTKVDTKAVLFIIARSANSTSGPPLAVKRIERPVFPLSYSLGPEDVMMPRVPFTGKVVVSALLDKDGNPTTREPGNLTGQYKKNPVEIGSEKVDIIVGQVFSND